MPAATQTFGRRNAATVAPAAPVDAASLDPAAAAFRAELRSDRSAPDGFAAWRKDQSGRRRAAWLATFALLTPGVLLFGLKSPMGVSAVVEVGGMAASWWLRRERRRHLKAIADWSLDSEA